MSIKNLEGVLWKFLGEYLEIELLPEKWWSFKKEDALGKCITYRGYLHLSNCEWILGDETQPIDVLRIHKITYTKD